MKKNNTSAKSKTLRSLSTGVVLLSAFSVLNVGFSSWIVGIEIEDKSLTADLTLEIGTVVDSNSLITFPSGGTFSIDISPNGFIIDEVYIYRYSFDITIPFTLKVKDGLDFYLGAKDAFKLNISLFNRGSFGILNPTFMSNPPASYLVEPANEITEPSINSSVIGGLVYTTINYSHVDLHNYEELDFEITYKFAFSPTNFETDVYKYFPDSNAVAFGMQISIEV